MACTFFLALDDPETDILAAAKRAPPPKPKKPKMVQHNYQDSPPLSVQPASNSHLPENLEPREITFDFGSWEGVFEGTMSTLLVFYCF